MPTTKRERISKIAAFSFALICAATSAWIFYTLQEKTEYTTHYSIGAAVIVLWLLYSFLVRKYRRRKKILAQPFPEKWEHLLLKKVKYYNMLGQQERSLFKNRMQIFLAEKLITGIETEVDDRIRVLVAASALIPVVKFPEWEYDNVLEILIYPSNFNDDFQFGENDSSILGMVGIGSTMILSKPSLLNGFKDPKDKLNVGIHEFMHKIDEKDGCIDGIPAALSNKKIQRQWSGIMRLEMQLMKDGQSDINPYGLTNEAEFFAVAGEYFFEHPEVMERKHPELYNVLTAVFRQDTKTIFKRTVKSLFIPYGKKTGRNSRCPCGSGKKYKHCCLRKK